MKTLVLSFLLFGLASARWYDSEEETPRTSRASCNCGWSNKGRIVGGKETKKNEFPLVVALEFPGSNDQYCGGTILTPFHVLTAAHCTHEVTPREMQIHAGAHDLNRSPGVRVRALRFIDHEHYVHGEYVNDISIVVTASQIPFNQNIGPACLPAQKLFHPQNEVLKALGWGNTRNQGRPSTFLQEVDLKVVNYRECVRNWPSAREATNVCTYESQKDTCQGDSGGPLVFLNPKTNRYTIAALVSYGGACAGPLPAVNTDVSAYLDWISRAIASTKHGVTACSLG